MEFAEAGAGDDGAGLPYSRARPFRLGAQLSGSAPNSATGAHPYPNAHAGPTTESPSLVALMRMTRDEWDLWTRRSAIRRAGYAGFMRNVAVAMGNWLAGVEEPPEEAMAVLEAVLGDQDLLVREHAEWALRQVRRS